MSLSFNFEQCNFGDKDGVLYGRLNDESNEDHREVLPITRTLIFATMSVGIGRITDKNVEEFYARFMLLDRLWGIATLKVPAEDPDEGFVDYTVSPDDVRQHIGLFTNVGNESREFWCRRMFQNKGTSVLRDYMHDYHRGIEKADKNKQEV